MSKGKISLHIKRDGWELSVVLKEDRAIVFIVGYRMFGSREWKIEQDSTKKALLANLEKAMIPYSDFVERRLFYTFVQMPVEWCAYPTKNQEYPYRIVVDWIIRESTFYQRNGGEIAITKEEVEILHQIFS